MLAAAVVIAVAGTSTVVSAGDTAVAPEGRPFHTFTSLTPLGVASDTALLDFDDPASLSVAISRLARPDGAARVVVARDDAFADSAAGGPLLSGAPLLLVPGSGPLPEVVEAEIERLGATHADVLGGAAAVSPTVASALADLGLQVRRLAGEDRIRTAVAIADAVTAARPTETVLLVRAGAEPQEDPTRAFADSLAAGALAARAGWPLLLSDATSLSAATRDWLHDVGVQEVVLVGGQAALGVLVEDAVRAIGPERSRVAGDDRADTAAALSELDEPATDQPRRAVVVDGEQATSWQAGFAAAALSAAWDAPLLLVGGTHVPVPTAAALAEAGISADSGRAGAVLACAAPSVATCRDVRAAAGLPPPAEIVLDHPLDEPLVPGTTVALRTSGATGVTVGGTCTEPSTADGLDGEPLLLRVVAEVPWPCTVQVGAVLPGGAVQRYEPLLLNNVPRRITLAATGDLLIHTDVTGRARQPDGSIDFAPLLAQVEPFISAADVGLCHLEVPLTRDLGDLSGYPTFNAPAQLADAIAATGWDVCSTASNHTLDQRFEGIVSTLDILDDAGVAHTGAARSEAEHLAATLLDVGQITLGFLSYTYGTNGIPVPAAQPWSVNLIDTPAIAAEASRVRDAGADLVVLSLHWGQEYAHRPSSFQTAIAAEVAASGLVDLIVGHHAHVIQPLAVVDGLPVAYGLGNFLSGQFQSVDRSDGVILLVTFAEQPGHVGEGFAVTFDWVPTRVDRSTYHVLPLHDPQTPVDQASAARTDAYLTGG